MNAWPLFMNRVPGYLLPEAGSIEAVTLEGAIAVGRRKHMRRQTVNKTRAGRPQEGQRRITSHHMVLYAALAAAIALTGGSSFAQHITGEPGSPNATQTIDGRYLPNP